MDYDVRDIETYLFIFDLPDKDKKCLAKFEGFENVEDWEKQKREHLKWLSDPDKNITYNIFCNISYDDNSSIGRHISMPELEKVAESIMKKINPNDNDDYNAIEFETRVSLWVLHNKSAYFVE